MAKRNGKASHRLFDNSFFGGTGYLPSCNSESNGALSMLLKNAFLCRLLTNPSEECRISSPNGVEEGVPARVWNEGGCPAELERSVVSFKPEVGSLVQTKWSRSAFQNC
jgi:hypothetical protein